jgi:ubiquinone/menaquinone biosynthesis C-methylase UbiE
MIPSVNRFEDFFADDSYVALKNHLYNYRLRKRAVGKCIQGQGEELILEVGSGLSPMVTGSDRVIYSELSFSALRFLKKSQAKGSFVVADATHLPFKGESISTVVCSEVLEHLPDDRLALGQIAGVMKKRGELILTFPHRRGYFAVDDHFVNHFRRYELAEMEERLREVGLNPMETRKVLGPLEKVTMALVASVALLFQRFRTSKEDLQAKRDQTGKGGLWAIIVPVFGMFNRLFCLPVWLDARLMPRCLSAVLLVRAVKSL